MFTGFIEVIGAEASAFINRTTQF